MQPRCGAVLPLCYRLGPMVSRPLRNLSRRPIRRKDVDAFTASLNLLSDQAVALVCAALVERSLERVMLSRLRRLTKTMHNELFAGLGPLASFSAKIKLAYALGIVGPEAVADLTKVKDIRNQFAHSFHPVSFRTRAIAGYCRQLKTPNNPRIVRPSGVRPWPLHRPRQRYWITCVILWVCLNGDDVRGPRPRKHDNLYDRDILR